jgi:hypothetical protein
MSFTSHGRSVTDMGFSSSSAVAKEDFFFLSLPDAPDEAGLFFSPLADILQTNINAQKVRQKGQIGNT